jgi:hypothetical protein
MPLIVILFTDTMLLWRNDLKKKKCGFPPKNVCSDSHTWPVCLLDNRVNNQP